MEMQNLEFRIQKPQCSTETATRPRSLSAFCILHSAFSLVEIMFAVMILGIGFIMIAAMFPVAIQQSQATVAETTGTIVAENAFRTLKQAPVACYSVGANWGPATLGNQQISASDPQFGFVCFSYRIDSTHCQIVTIAVQSHNTSAFTGNSYLYDLKPSVVAPVRHTCQIPASGVVVNKDDFGSIQFDSANPVGVSQAVEGAYVLIYDDATLSKGVLQVGTLVNPATNTWTLLPFAPGASTSDIPNGSTNAVTVHAFIIGRGLRYPDQAFDATNNPYEGPSIAVHATPMQTVTK